MADELDDQAAMAQWASQNPPGAFGEGDAGGGGTNEFGDFSGGMGGWDDGGGDGMGAERILNQDEIDSLLGFDLSGDGGEDRTGIRAIINSALVSYERLRFRAFDRVVFRIEPLAATLEGIENEMAEKRKLRAVKPRGSH